MSIDRKYGHVTVETDSSEHPLNGTDEPVFLIRANDLSAIEALHDYRRAADMVGADEAMTDMIENAIEDFTMWQLEHSEYLKIPD